jgi:ethanolamine transporter EutH
MMKRIIAIIILICFSTAIFAQSSEVVIDETILEPKDPILATVIALGPGLLAHGFGQFYAENFRMGLLLFSLELVSLLTIGVGYLEYSNPSGFTIVGGNEGEVKHAGAIVMAIGVTGFIATWLADIALAGRSAEQYNTEHNLKFKLQQESNNLIPGLMYTYNF